MERRKLEIERAALDLRNRFKIESYGIRDIFSIVDKMDIYLIRIPLGKDTICGFSTVYKGKKVIVSNSSEILSREIFTIAHEIGHCEYDLDTDEQRIIIDKNVNTDTEDFIEKRADYFAAVFLLPEEQITNFIKYELEKDSSEIRARDVIRMQIEFNESFAAIVLRLYEFGFIDLNLKNQLFDERDSKTSRMLFHAMNLNDDLIKPADILKVPNKYYEYVFSNYENGYVVFDKLKEALELGGFNTTEIDERETRKDEDIDLDELLEGF
ncbi:MAG: ImmA/IrrE family metallo-endopeptidase [Bacillota bacterium]|nr:ImmA/IrrE family metallo-endopeptidase [Bacillota bacterium]